MTTRRDFVGSMLVGYIGKERASAMEAQVEAAVERKETKPRDLERLRLCAQFVSVACEYSGPYGYINKRLYNNWLYLHPPIGK